VTIGSSGTDHVQTRSPAFFVVPVAGLPPTVFGAFEPGGPDPACHPCVESPAQVHGSPYAAVAGQCAGRNEDVSEQYRCDGVSRPAVHVDQDGER
jgi:hypothetical protein